MVNSGKHKRKRITSIKPTKSQLHVLEKLKRLDLGLHVIWGKRGLPSHLCGILSVEMEDVPEIAARKFLSEHFKLFKMKESLEDLTFLRKIDSLGGFHVVFQQFINELPVYNVFTSVHIDKNNMINKIDICYNPDLFVELPLGKGISQEEAIRIAIDTLKATGRGRVFIPNPVVALGDIKLTAESEIPDRAYTDVVLNDLDGSDYLKGTYVDTCTTPNRAKEPDLIYNYSRSDQGFKEVMAYFHIDEAQRYIQSLGFTNLCSKTIKVNVQGDFVDNSYYNPDTRE